MDRAYFGNIFWKTPPFLLLHGLWLSKKNSLTWRGFPNSIYFRCDTINPDGSEKQSTEVVPFTFSHAQKLRSSLTYGFGRQYKRGNNAWVFKTDAGEWDGNPSLSTEVARYMISLRKRKV